MPASTSPSSTAPVTPGDAEALSSAEARGRRALEEMKRASAASSGDDPFAALKPKLSSGPALTPEELAPMDPSEGVMPEVISNRMLSRVVPFAAIPVGGSVLVFVAFWFANTQLGLDLPPTIVAYATQAMLLLSFAGITYGVMSTQMDEGKEQTMLGAENFMTNLNNMRGAEADRIGQTKLENELDEAAKAGIVMGTAGLKKRQKMDEKKNK